MKPEDVQFIKKNMPDFWCSHGQFTPVGLHTLFRKGDKIETFSKYVETKFKFSPSDENSKKIEFTMVYIPEHFESMPENYVHTDKY